VDRAEFAAMIQKLLTKTSSGYKCRYVYRCSSLTGRLLQLRKPTKPDLWEAILVLCFSPDQEIPKVQAIVALANGLNLTASSASDIVSTYYTDARVLPTYAVDDVAAATQCCRQPSE